jgi:uncharacterized protein (TIGR02246 family)
MYDDNWAVSCDGELIRFSAIWRPVVKVRSLKIPVMLSLLSCTAGVAQAATSDETAIRGIESAQEQAWNAHDAHAYMQLFTPDAVVINVLGWQWKGREEAEQKLGDAFSFVFAQSRLTVDDVKIRTLSPDLALAYVIWTMVGAKSPDASGGNIPQHGIQTQLLQKTNGRWLILSFQNTNSIPERPFPKATAQPPANTEPMRRCFLANRDGKCLIRK